MKRYRPRKLYVRRAIRAHQRFLQRFAFIWRTPIEYAAGNHRGVAAMITDRGCTVCDKIEWPTMAQCEQAERLGWLEPERGEST